MASRLRHWLSPLLLLLLAAGTAPQPDTSPPGYTAATPRLDTAGATGAAVGVALTEPGTAFYVLLPLAAPPPSTPDVLSSSARVDQELARCVHVRVWQAAKRAG